MGCLKDNEYLRSPTTVPKLRAAITRECTQTLDEMVFTACDSISSHFQKYADQNGHKHLINTGCIMSPGVCTLLVGILNRYVQLKVIGCLRLPCDSYYQSTYHSLISAITFEPMLCLTRTRTDWLRLVGIGSVNSRCKRSAIAQCCMRHILGGLPIFI